MRKLVLSAGFLMLFLVNAFSQTASSVTMFSQDGEKFWVIINGIKQNDAPQTNVKITGLLEPNYKFKVIFEDEQIPSIDKMIYTRDYDGKYYNASYVVKKDKKGKFVVQMNSYDEAQATAATGQYSAPLSLEEKPAAATTTTQQTQTQTQTANPTQTTDKQTVTRQTTTVQQTTTTNPDAGGGSVGIKVVDPVTGEEINVNMGVQVGGTATDKQTQTQNVTTTVTTTTTTTTTDQTATQPKQETPVTPAKPDHYVMPGYNGKIGCPWPMQEGDFNSAKQSISKQSFEDTRLTVAKQVLESNCMTCEQIKGIMGVFSFEDSRLEFAKFAYGYVYDPGNYYKLNDAFSFSSSVDELNQYLKTKK